MELDINISPTLSCPECKKKFNVSKEMSGTNVQCSACDTKLDVYLFPELFRNISSVNADNVSGLDQEASCFFHENKVASSHCSNCGRFICKLCEIEIGEECLCPSCASGDNRKKKKTLKNRTTLYDKIALYLTVYPLFLVFTVYLTIITAPIGIFVSIKYWNRQESVIQRSNIRFIIALIFGTIEVIGWIALFYYIFNILPNTVSEAAK